MARRTGKREDELAAAIERSREKLGEVLRCESHYDNGNLRYAGWLLDGEMHGEWSFYRRDGTLMRSGSFERGKQMGVWKTVAR
jgi:antitoxin component YwqK of YwqJK toxin-antitoxin module